MLSNALQIENLTKEERFSSLKIKVHDLIGNPLSSWAVAATIESVGIREIDVQTDYGFDNVFDLADQIYKELKNEIASSRTKKKEEELEEDQKLGDSGDSIKLFFRYYGKGIVFSLPMISQIAAILIFEYALWAWFDFNEAQATIIAIGTIAAFVVTGGFIQVIGRLVSKYKGEGNYFLARSSIMAVLKVSFPAVAVFAILFIVLNLFLPFFPMKMVLLSMVYFILISVFLLSSAILYAIEKSYLILISVLLGTAMVVLGMEFLNFGIYFSQLAGILIAFIFVSIASFLFFFFKIRSLKQGLSNQSLPKIEVSVYNTYRYFIYGSAYFAFLFMDRILAWSAGPPPPPYIIWFDTAYELGMDWALISLVLTIATLEFSIQLFSKKLIPAQKRANLLDMKKFNSYFQWFYRSQILLLIVISIVSILASYYGILSLRVFENQIPELRDFFSNPITYKIFWIASISYVFLIYGLLNSLFFFTLNRPEFVMYPMLVALFINATVGFICSRMISYEFAVIGLLAGSITFAVITAILARKFFKHLDYFYYSAY